MMANSTPQDAARLDLATVIDSRIGAAFFADFGQVETVNNDGTIDVVHSVKMVTRAGDVLSVKSASVEVLWPAGAAFGIKWPVKAGDGVLLVGLRNYLGSVSDPAEAEPAALRHYTQDCLKAIPLWAAQDGAGLLEVDSDDNITMESKAGLAVKASDNVDVSGAEVHLNGDGKQFVTWDALNTALQNHTHGAGSLISSPTGGPVTGTTGSPIALDISGAKTTTIKTGG